MKKVLYATSGVDSCLNCLSLILRACSVSVIKTMFHTFPRILEGVIDDDDGVVVVVGKVLVVGVVRVVGVLVVAVVVATVELSQMSCTIFSVSRCSSIFCSRSARESPSKNCSNNKMCACVFLLSILSRDVSFKLASFDDAMYNGRFCFCFISCSCCFFFLLVRFHCLTSVYYDYHCCRDN